MKRDWVSLIIAGLSILISAYNIGFARGNEVSVRWRRLYDSSNERANNCRDRLRVCEAKR